jgi:hypothetical protein
MMKVSRLMATLAAAIAVVAFPAAAQAATITQSFHADSGDVCRYGFTDGTLGWRFGTTSPLPVIGVDVNGKLTDRPLPADPSTACRDDHYYSTATFTAYAGSVAVDRQTRNADNGAVTFQFTLGSSSSTTHIDRVVIQVCRSPINTLPPSYCGQAVVYFAPPVG